jgi:hypothetical protein
MPKYSGYVGIAPVRRLAETAAILGDVLGLVFTEDTEGRFDEFPAFIAEASGLQYALLGIPDADEDIRDNPTNDFELQVVSTVPTSGNATDISEELIAKLKKDGRLKCWLLK